MYIYVEKTNIIWPEIDKKYLEEKRIQIVIQINGKKRGLLDVDKDVNEKQIINSIKTMPLYEKYFNNTKIVKSIYVKNRLINLIIK